MTARAPEPLRDILLVHDAQALSGDAAARDVAGQMEALEAALRELGHGVMRLPVDIDLGRFKNRLAALRPGLVFNLVESLDGSDRLQTIIPMLLEDWRIPFTGSGSAAMLLANDKIGGKRLLADHGLPVPPGAWLDARGRLLFLPGERAGTGGADWIVKTRDSHASLFLDDASVLRGATARDVADRLEAVEAMHCRPFFAEGFVDGREFNISLVERLPGVPEVLPPAEISFAGMPAGRPRIVGYAAKWEEDSPEYQGSTRTFEARPGDADLYAELSRLALEAWRVFGLAGYARIDFRVDAENRPFILEANANPCLSPDAGLAAAAERGGMAFKDLTALIVAAGLERK